MNLRTCFLVKGSLGLTAVLNSHFMPRTIKLNFLPDSGVSKPARPQNQFMAAENASITATDFFGANTRIRKASTTRSSGGKTAAPLARANNFHRSQALSYETPVVAATLARAKKSPFFRISFSSSLLAFFHALSFCAWLNFAHAAARTALAHNFDCIFDLNIAGWVGGI
jgi:hypothetical protein